MASVPRREACAVPDPAPAPCSDPASAHDGLVFLRVPADARYARVVRIAVSAFAVRLHLPAPAVEDLRLAADEALILLLGTAAAAGSDEVAAAGHGPAAAEDADVVVSLEARDDRLPVLLRLQLDPAPVASGDDPAALARFRELVPEAMVVDRVDREAGRVELRLPA
jgi:hypothetical protein